MTRGEGVNTRGRPRRAAGWLGRLLASKVQPKWENAPIATLPRVQVIRYCPQQRREAVAVVAGPSRMAPRERVRAFARGERVVL